MMTSLLYFFSSFFLRIITEIEDPFHSLLQESKPVALKVSGISHISIGGGSLEVYIHPAACLPSRFDD